MKRAPPKYLFMSEKLLCPPMVGLGGISSVSGKWKNFISLHIESIHEKEKKSRKEKEAGRLNGNFMKLQEKTYIRTCGWGAQPSAARGVLKFERSLTPAV